jgi:outer membrane immunogenic protein
MLPKSPAAGGIRFKNEPRRMRLFKPLTVASVLAVACAVTAGSAQAEALLNHNGGLNDFNHNGSLKDTNNNGRPDDFNHNGDLKGLPHRPPCAVFHGFYHGYHVGTGSHDWTWSDRDAWAKEEEEDFPSFVGGTDNGAIGGLQAGYNWQRGCTVFGLEADWSWAALAGTKIYGDEPDDDVSLRVQSQLGGFGTLRTRAGLVVDNVLLYMTGGLAFANFERRWTLQDDDDLETFASSETRLGWATGFGVEWALTDRITIKSEALWLRFDDVSVSSFNNHNNNHNNDDDEHARFDLQDNLFVARIGMNFKFDSPAPFDFPWPLR